MTYCRELLQKWMDREGLTIEGLKEVGWALLSFSQFVDLHLENKVDPSVSEALAEAVQTIYFADSGDCLPALWSIVRKLGGEAAVLQLMSNERAAYVRYVLDRDRE